MPNRQGAVARAVALRFDARWRFVLGLFLFVKLTIVATGYLAVRVMENTHNAIPPTEFMTNLAREQSAISTYRPFSMWYVWDGLIYRKLAKTDYFAPAYASDLPSRPFWTSTPADVPHLIDNGRFCFYPAFPVLSGWVGVVLGSLRDLGTLLVANAAFVAVLYFGYRLGEQLFSSHRAARRFTKFVILIPGAIVLHGASSESLFLAFVLAAFFYAETGRWVVAGLVGAGAALTRSVGVLVVVPLALLACQQGWSHRVAGQSWLRAVLPKLMGLVSVPLGCLSMLAYCRAMTGDWFAYSRIQNEMFHMHFRVTLRPFSKALNGEAATSEVLNAYLVLGSLALLGFGIRSVRLPYLVYAAAFALIPLGAGNPAGGLNESVVRYLGVVFPIAIPLVHFTKSRESESRAMFALATLQGVLLVLWVNYWLSFMI